MMKSFMKFIYLLIAFNLRTHQIRAFDINEDDLENQYFLPTIQLILLIHPYNKVSVLPFSLGSIEAQTYPKDRIKVFIRTELYKNEDSTQDNETLEDKIQMNSLTIDMLKKWIRHNRHQYNDIEFVLGDNSIEDNDKELKYWSTNRFKHIIELKSNAIEFSRKNWAQFVLFIDSDVVLTNNKAFESLTQNEEAVVMAPMLYSLGTYSNFWAGTTENGYYKRTDDYLPILERQRLGEFAVPMIHCCFLINLSHKKSVNLTFDSRKFEELSPFDDIIAFAKSAKINNIQLFVNNREVWGYVPPPIDTNTNMKSLEQDIIDLELESLIEGPEFPIASSLVSCVNRPKPDKLNVDNVYVINLWRRHERRKRMLKCLEILGIDAQVWRATDGKELNDKIIESKGIKVVEGYLDPYHKRPMTFGEIGCFLSHFSIWQDIIRRNLSKAIVLEDDVRFERNFKNRWKAALSLLNTGEYDFVYLGRKLQGESINETRIKEMFVKPTFSYWTIGYFITRKGAQKLLDINPLEKLIPVDEFLPIMYDKHYDPLLKQHFPIRNLNALSLSPLLIYPTHYVGDSQYISDTEDSNKMTEKANKNAHPKNSEL